MKQTDSSWGSHNDYLGTTSIMTLLQKCKPKPPPAKTYFLP